MKRYQTPRVPLGVALSTLARGVAPYLGFVVAVALGCFFAAWLDGCGGEPFTLAAGDAGDAGDALEAAAVDVDAGEASPAVQDGSSLDAGAGDDDASSPPRDAAAVVDAATNQGAAAVDAGDAGDDARAPVDAGAVDAAPPAPRCCQLSCGGAARLTCGNGAPAWTCGQSCAAGCALGAQCFYAAGGCFGTVVPCQ